MFELRRITAFVGTAAAATALGLTAVTTASTAMASSMASSTDDTFISVITEEGIEPPPAKEATGVAHDVCTMLDDGADLYDAVSSVSEFTELAVEPSAFFVGASIASYCPEYKGLIDA
jgi:Protein of unknown function (DUF732)